MFIIALKTILNGKSRLSFLPSDSIILVTTTNGPTYQIQNKVIMNIFIRSSRDRQKKGKRPPWGRDSRVENHWTSQVVCKDANCVANAEINCRCLVLPMQKQKHNWNWSVHYYILRIRFSKISLFRMVLKRLKSHRFCNGVARTFSYTQAWVSERGRDLKISSKKTLFLVSSSKKQISPH